MNHLKDFKPTKNRTKDYYDLCEENNGLIKRCIDLAIYSERTELINSLDSRYKERGRSYRADDGLEITVFSPLGAANYVVVNYKGERVLTASHEYSLIELDEESHETMEVLDIGKLVYGEWVKEVDKHHKKYFSKNPIEVIKLQV
ncbi:hypothetical protein J4437_01930 [Candidatus Woesearchaeota archaeon]|nr:hypothetical protein [Candidatus Woesearchaeota archaeon]